MNPLNFSDISRSAFFATVRILSSATLNSKRCKYLIYRNYPANGSLPVGLVLFAKQLAVGGVTLGIAGGFVTNVTKSNNGSILKLRSFTQ